MCLTATWPSVHRVEVLHGVSSQALKGGGIFSTFPNTRPVERTPTGGGDAGASDGELEAGNCFFVFIFAAGRSDERGLAIRAADGEWVSITQISSAMLAHTDASLCVVVASTFNLEDAMSGLTDTVGRLNAEEEKSAKILDRRRAASTLLLPRRASSTTNLRIDSWRTLVQLWTLVQYCGHRCKTVDTGTILSPHARTLTP